MLTLLFTKLRDIKVTILKLDAKIDTSYQELTAKMIDNKEFYELITSQNEKITKLQQENEDLKMLNRALKNEITKMEEDMLCLKVNITGIPESGHKSYEVLCNKIAEIMTSVCEGRTEEAHWGTSINIPITDCQRLGTCMRNRK